MAIRSPALRVLLFAALLIAAAGSTVQAQRASRRESSLARGWAAAGSDSAAVDRLYQATVRTGGPELFGAVLAAARDPHRPTVVRVYALSALQAYAIPDRGSHPSEFFWAARDAGIRCETSRAWAPGDTLLACMRGITIIDYALLTTPPPAALTVDPARRDSIVAVARAIARGGRSPVAGAGDLLLWLLNVPRPVTRARPVDDCPEAGGVVFLARGAAERVYRLEEVSQPPVLENACRVARLVTRNYPPLARDAGEKGTVVLSLVVDSHGMARDAAVEPGPLRPEFGEAVMRVVGQMRFAPARVGGAPVAVRISMPIRFGFGSEFPRVSNP